MKKFLHTLIITFITSPICLGQLTSFFIQPNVIDPNYDASQDSHYVAVNPSVTSNKKLLVFLPGTGAKTKHYLQFPDLAASLGYHCVSIAYPNGYPTVATSCAGNSDVDCYHDIRQEVCYGTDVSTYVTVDTLNSIVVRLSKLLQYLDTNYPTQGWGQFLNGTDPVWSSIVTSGHSQGGGHALYLAKTNTCERMIMFAGADDYSNYYSSPANWISWSSLTPVSRFFSFLSLYDDVWAYSKQFAVAQAAGMTANGDDSTLVDNLSSPYNNSHCLYTKATPPYSGVYSAYHNSMVVDFYLPLDGSNQPIFIPVWTYMLTADVTTGVSSSENFTQGIKAFPNPASEKVTITSTIQLNDNVEIDFYNYLGEKILTQEYGSISNATIDISHLPIGVYNINIRNNEQKINNQKLIISR